MSNTYDIVLAQEPWDKAWEYVHACPTEVAVFGYVTEQDCGLYVDEVFLVPQIVSPTEVDFFSEGLPYAVQKATNDGRLEDLRFCLHSHVNFPANWSGTDEEMIEKMCDGTMMPWFASVIFNKRGDMTGRVDLFSGGSALNLKHIRDIGLKVRCENDPDDGPNEDTIKELESFLKKPPKQMYVPTGSGKAKKKVDVPQHILMANTEFDPDTMSNDQLEKEWNNALEVYKTGKQSGWTVHEDDQGWVYWFDGKDQFMASCLSLEDVPDTTLEELWNTPSSDRDQQAWGDDLPVNVLT